MQITKISFTNFFTKILLSFTKISFTKIGFMQITKINFTRISFTNISFIQCDILRVGGLTWQELAVGDYQDKPQTAQSSPLTWSRTIYKLCISSHFCFSCAALIISKLFGVDWVGAVEYRRVNPSPPAPTLQAPFAPSDQGNLSSKGVSCLPSPSPLQSSPLFSFF